VPSDEAKMTFFSSAVIGELVARAFAGMLDMVVSLTKKQRRDHGAEVHCRTTV